METWSKPLSLSIYIYINFYYVIRGGDLFLEWWICLAFYIFKLVFLNLYLKRLFMVVKLILECFLVVVTVFKIYLGVNFFFFWIKFDFFLKNLISSSKMYKIVINWQLFRLVCIFSTYVQSSIITSHYNLNIIYN